MLDHTIMDVAVRWHRMKGETTLWVPGNDHAGIATQMVVERQLAAEGITRQQLGREEFERRVWVWKEEYGGRINNQIRREGASVDWRRERFTMDPGLSRAVRETFVRLWEKGLIYRGEYMVNWCPRCQTAISDVETAHESVEGHLWHIRYAVTGSDESLVVATTRPETMLGDTALVVNPEDPRCTAKQRSFRSSAAKSRLFRTLSLTPNSAPASSKSPPLTTLMTSRQGSATTFPSSRSSAKMRA